MSFLSNVVPAGASQALLGTKRPFEGYTWEVFLLVGVLSHRIRGEIATPRASIEVVTIDSE